MTRSLALLRLGLLLLLLGAVAFTAHRAGLFALRDPAALLAAIERARSVPYVPVLFVLAYALIATFGLPALPFTLAGGILFGVGPGIALNWTGATLGATGLYGLARALGGDALRRLLGARATRLDLLAGEAGFRTLLRLRLIPAVPFNALSLAAALSGIRWPTYVLATSLGILPGTVIYTYFAGSLVRGVAGADRTARTNLIVASLLLLALSFLPALWRRRRPAESASRESGGGKRA
jgi:uncharacterized membrane protein YdjX (TVP38/TMEM64 family)